MTYKHMARIVHLVWRCEEYEGTWEDETFYSPQIRDQQMDMFQEEDGGILVNGWCMPEDDQ